MHKVQLYKEESAKCRRLSSIRLKLTWPRTYNSPRGWKTSNKWKLAPNVNRFFHDRYISCNIYTSYGPPCLSTRNADLLGWQDWTETMGANGSSKHWLDYDILLSRNGSGKLGLECGVGEEEGAAPVWCHACEMRIKRAELQGWSWFLRKQCLTWRCSKWKTKGVAEITKAWLNGVC